MHVLGTIKPKVQHYKGLSALLRIHDQWHWGLEWPQATNCQLAFQIQPCVVLIKLEISLYRGSGFTSKVSILSHDLLVKSIYFVFVCSADTSLYYFEAKAAGLILFCLLVQYTHKRQSKTQSEWNVRVGRCFLLNFLLTMVELMALSPHSEKVLYLNFGPFCVEFIYSHCLHGYSSGIPPTVQRLAWVQVKWWFWFDFMCELLSVSVWWPCEREATCPGYTLSLALWIL